MKFCWNCNAQIKKDDIMCPFCACAQIGKRKLKKKDDKKDSFKDNNKDNNK